MLTTSTHDTKRSEDVRARLALLSEIPDRWIAAVRRWSALNEHHRRDGWPDRNAEYFIYQTLVGAWPLSLDRALATLEKAAREAKQHTDWSDRNAAYETALKDFVLRVLADRGFVAELERFVKPLVRPGYVNSLAQTLVKLTAPGVPDLYQGTELWDFSLVDPDNRRPVDFALRRAALAALNRRPGTAGLQARVSELVQNPTDGRIKLWVIHQTLQCRRSHVALFRDGGYVPLLTTGPQAEHVFAFARTLDRATVLTVIPRLILGLAGRREALPLGGDAWGDTRFLLPRRQAGRPFRNVLTGEVVCLVKEGPHASLRLADLLGRFPVALLEPHGPIQPPGPPPEPGAGSPQGARAMPDTV